MRINWKKWSVIAGSAVVATGLFAFSSVIPVTGFFMIPVIIGGAIWSTVIELKEEERKEKEIYEKKKEETKQVQEDQFIHPHFPFDTIEEGFFVLHKKSMMIQSQNIQQVFRDMYQEAVFLSEHEKDLSEEDRRFITHSCYYALEQLLSTYLRLEKEGQEREEKDILNLAEVTNEHLKQIKEQMIQEKEREFQKTKRVLQEKLKRY